MIRRRPEEDVDYEQWKRTLSRRRLLNWITDQYAVFQVGGQLDESIDFLKTPSTNGFVIHFHRTQYPKREVVHFFDYLKERILLLNYRSQISDRRVFSRKDWVETQERHYLKPRNSYQEGTPIWQGFGNITVELEYRDDRIYNLRLRATSYRDALYADADSFRSLVSELGDVN